MDNTAKQEIVKNFIESYIAKSNEYDKYENIVLNYEADFAECGSISVRLYTVRENNKGNVVRVTNFYATAADRELREQGSLAFNKYHIEEMLKHLYD